jgi:phosphoenolpyruvate-protein phosphotransferase (PTS system enzyme I)
VGDELARRSLSKWRAAAERAVSAPDRVQARERARAALDG